MAVVEVEASNVRLAAVDTGIRQQVLVDLHRKFGTHCVTAFSRRPPVLGTVVDVPLTGACPASGLESVRSLRPTVELRDRKQHMACAAFLHLRNAQDTNNLGHHRF